MNIMFPKLLSESKEVELNVGDHVEMSVYDSGYLVGVVSAVGRDHIILDGVCWTGTCYSCQVLPTEITNDELFELDIVAEIRSIPIEQYNYCLGQPV